jgi:hypothetical protein
MVFSFIKKKWELVVVFLLAITGILLLIFQVDAILIYQENSMNSLILGMFGSLFGLLLASYSILFGLLPALSKDALRSKALKGVNFRFFLAMLMNLIVLILGLVIYFTNGKYQSFLIYSQIFIVIALLAIFAFLIFYLLLLFKSAQKKQSLAKNS